MEYILDRASLQFIWSALREPALPSKFQQALKLSHSIVEKGWAFKADVEDLLYYLDNRFGFQIDVIEYSKMFQIHWEHVYFRPKLNSNSISEYDAIRAEEAALFLIILERIGFQVEATVLVDLLLSSLRKRNRKVLNNAELETFWYSKTRHKYGKIVLVTESGSTPLKQIDNFKTIGKYHIVVKGMEESAPQLIEILSPKFRKKPASKLVVCKLCGAEWYKGDPDSSARHRKEHKARMNYLDPKPLTQMVTEFESLENPELVIITSPAWKHKEMYERARAFRREFGYDFVQWQSEKGDKDPNVIGFLLTNQSWAIVGACSFRRKVNNKNTWNWTLDWVWICPQERRKGHLASRWKMFRERFGTFNLTFPVSDEMKAFLTKQGDERLLEL